MVSLHNSELMRWWALQPVTTKWIGLLSLLIPVLLKFRLLPSEYVVFYWPWIWRNLQVNIDVYFVLDPFVGLETI